MDQQGLPGNFVAGNFVDRARLARRERDACAALMAIGLFRALANLVPKARPGLLQSASRIIRASVSESSARITPRTRS